MWVWGVLLCGPVEYMAVVSGRNITCSAQLRDFSGGEEGKITEGAVTAVGGSVR